MASTQEPQLPTELLLFIFRQLDRPCLSACSLVSHGFLELSRSFLFEKLVCRMQCTQPNESPNAPACRRLRSLVDVLTYLRSSPGVCAHIRHLCLWRKSSMFRYGMGAAESEDSLFATLVEILTRLPKLHSLEMDGISFVPPELGYNPIGLFCDTPVVSRLRTLHLIGCKLQGSSQYTRSFFHLLSLFGQVDRLFISCIGAEECGQDTEALISRIPIKIHSLTIRPRPDILNSLALLPHISAVRSLDLPEAPCHVLAPFFAAAGPTLEHLSCALLESPSLSQYKTRLSPHELAPLDCALLPALQSLAVTLSALVLPNAAEDGVDVLLYGRVYATLMDMLQALPPTLHTVELRVACLPLTGVFAARHNGMPAVSIGGVPLQADWRPLDKLLAERVGTGLRIVRFAEAIRPCFGGDVRAQLVRLLPQLAKTGVLEFV